MDNVSGYTGFSPEIIAPLSQDEAGRSSPVWSGKYAQRAQRIQLAGTYYPFVCLRAARKDVHKPIDSCGFGKLVVQQ